MRDASMANFAWGAMFGAFVMLCLYTKMADNDEE